MHLEVESSKGPRSIRIEGEELSRPLSELLRRQGMPLNTRCGQRGLCDGCRVELLEGSVVDVDTGRVLEAAGCAGEIKGCMHRPDPACAAIKVRVPDRSLTSYEPQVVSDFYVSIPFGQDPIYRAGRDLPRLATDSPIGAAIDVGTTTVAVLLVELNSGKVLARSAGFNRQMHLGDDVLTRINLCMTDTSLVGRLQEAIVNETIARLLADAMKQAKVTPDRLAVVTAAGNTTMLHLLAGVDPTPMGLAPFTPAFLEHRTLTLTEVELRWPDQHTLAYPDPDASPRLHLLPGAAAYVGADLTAGVIATGLRYHGGTCLLVDVGTNGEIILKHDEHLLGCATAAGPAFEGGGLTDGIRAGHGAISHIKITADPFAIDATVIGDAAPIGICGSAYIDVLAEGLRTGILSAAGRFDLDGFPQVAPRLREQSCYGFMLHVAAGKGKEGIFIGEIDVSRLLQAKAAIAAGILTLLERVGKTPADVDTLFLAGGFGMHVDLDNALHCGLLPGFTRDQVKLVGNTSLAGAYVALLDRSLLPEIARVGADLDVVELNLDPGFENRYIDQLSLTPA